MILLILKIDESQFLCKAILSFFSSMEFDFKKICSVFIILKKNFQVVGFFLIDKMAGSDDYWTG